MRKEAEDFDPAALTLVYVARKLKDALRAEAWLTAAGIDYSIETDEFTSGLVFRTKRVGAFFYVPAEGEAAARESLRQGGFRPPDESGRF